LKSSELCHESKITGTAITGSTDRRKQSRFNTIRVMAKTRQAEADALPPGPAKRKLQEEANSYRILSEAKIGSQDRKQRAGLPVS
jgi:hypothetical protein